MLFQLLLNEFIFLIGLGWEVLRDILQGLFLAVIAIEEVVLLLKWVDILLVELLHKLKVLDGVLLLSLDTAAIADGSEGEIQIVAH